MSLKIDSIDAIVCCIFILVFVHIHEAILLITIISKLPPISLLRVGNCFSLLDRLENCKGYLEVLSSGWKLLMEMIEPFFSCAKIAFLFFFQSSQSNGKNTFYKSSSDGE